MATYFPHWLCIQYILQYAANAQTETMFYFNGFEDPSDWTQVSGASSNGKGVIWQPSTFGGCNHLKTNSVSSSCLSLYGDADHPGVVSTIISTVGYHTIRLQIDMRVVGLETNEICYIEYRSSSIDWSRYILAYGGGNDYNTFDEEVNIPSGENYDNKASFEIRIGIDANSGGDGCYFDNLEVFGIKYTTTISPTTISTTTITPSSISPTTLSPTAILPTSISSTTIAPTTISPTTTSSTTIAPSSKSPSSISPTAISSTTKSPTSISSSSISPTSISPTIHPFITQSLITTKLATTTPKPTLSPFGSSFTSADNHIEPTKHPSVAVKEVYGTFTFVTEDDAPSNTVDNINNPNDLSMIIYISFAILVLLFICCLSVSIYSCMSHKISIQPGSEKGELSCSNTDVMDSNHSMGTDHDEEGHMHIGTESDVLTPGDEPEYDHKTVLTLEIGTMNKQKINVRQSLLTDVDDSYTEEGNIVIPNNNEELVAEYMKKYGKLPLDATQLVIFGKTIFAPISYIQAREILLSINGKKLNKSKQSTTIS